MHILLCFLERNGRFCFVTAFIPTPRSALHTVFTVKDVLVISCKVLVASVALSAFWEVIRQIVYWVSVGESLCGRPPVALEIDDQCLECIPDIEPTLIPVVVKIACSESPLSRSLRTQLYWAGVSDCMGVFESIWCGGQSQLVHIVYIHIWSQSHGFICSYLVWLNKVTCLIYGRDKTIQMYLYQ